LAAISASKVENVLSGLGASSWLWISPSWQRIPSRVCRHRFHPLAFALYPIQELDTLDIMQKIADAGLLAQFGQVTFAFMAEWRMADIMAQGDCLDEVFVEPEKTADGAGNLGNQLHMQHPVRDVVVGNQVKYLGLVDVAGVGPTVQNPVRIQGKGLPVTGSVSNDGMAADA
jgi:hypothetical protein